MYGASELYFVTARTTQARLLLRPGVSTNALVAGVLARAVAKTEVKLHAFVVMSNHVHLLVSAEGVRLSSFMQQFLGNTARKVGRLVGWEGRFWGRRFSMQPVLDDAAAEGRLRYIVSHGVKEGLVRRPEEWPGLSCLGLLRSGGEVRAQFFHWSRRWESGRLVEGGVGLLDERWAEEVGLVLTPLPGWEGLTPEARRLRVETMVEGIVEEHARRNRRVKGAEAVCLERPQRRPVKAARRRAPACFATTQSGKEQLRALRASWLAGFLAVSARFREGQVSLRAFPLESFAPPSANTGRARGASEPTDKSGQIGKTSMTWSDHGRIDEAGRGGTQRRAGLWPAAPGT
jgi:REP element-mobilizing transposase RayT